MALLSTGKAAEYIGMSVPGLRHVIDRGELTPLVTKSGRFKFTTESLDEYLGLTSEGNTEAIAIYARVSSNSAEQKSSLANHVDELTSKAELPVHKVYKDTSSGLNDNRPGLNKLLDDAAEGKFARVYCTHPDRLTRFGHAYLERYLTSNGVTITYLNEGNDKSKKEELLQDITNLLASFTGKMYGLRSAENRRKLIKRVEESGDSGETE